MDVELALTIKKAFLGLCALQVALVLILLRNTNKNWGFTFFELPSIPWIKYGVSLYIDFGTESNDTHRVKTVPMAVM